MLQTGCYPVEKSIGFAGTGTELSLLQVGNLNQDIGITSVPSDSISADAKKISDLGFKVFKFWPSATDFENDEIKTVFQNAKLEVLIIKPPKTWDFAATAQLLFEKFDMNKTVILTNWESDWVLSGGAKCFYDPNCIAPKGKPLELATQFSANQTGISALRNQFPNSKLKIYYAVEVNLVLLAPKLGKVSVTNDVIPLMNPKPDYISYSSWETVNVLGIDSIAAEGDFIKALDLISLKVGHRNIFIGEFGYGANLPGSRRKALSKAVALGRQWGTPYFVYWNLLGQEFGLDKEAYEALQK